DPRGVAPRHYPVPARHDPRAAAADGVLSRPPADLPDEPGGAGLGVDPELERARRPVAVGAILIDRQVPPSIEHARVVLAPELLPAAMVAEDPQALRRTRAAELPHDLAGGLVDLVHGIEMASRDHDPVADLRDRVQVDDVVGAAVVVDPDGIPVPDDLPEPAPPGLGGLDVAGRAPAPDQAPQRIDLLHLAVEHGRPLRTAPPTQVDAVARRIARQQHVAVREHLELVLVGVGPDRPVGADQPPVEPALLAVAARRVV